MRQLKILQRIAVREGQALDKYLNEVSKFKMVSSEEEMELAKRARNGDDLAREKLLTANLRFVVSVAKQYQHSGLSLSDLVNEGNIGLLKAVNKFDESRGFKFISYAVWWVRQAILQAVAEKSRLIKIPLNKVTELYSLKNALHKLEQQLCRTPSPEEIAESMGMSVDYVLDLLDTEQDVVSADAPYGNDNEHMTYGCTLKSDQAMEPGAALNSESFNKDFNDSLSILNKPETYVIGNFYGLKGNTTKTFEEIAGEMELSRERVRQIKYGVLRKLRYSPITKRLRRYL